MREERGFWAGVRSMVKRLNGRGHEDSVYQIREPDLTVNTPHGNNLRNLRIKNELRWRPE